MYLLKKFEKKLKKVVDEFFEVSIVMCSAARDGCESGLTAKPHCLWQCAGNARCPEGRFAFLNGLLSRKG